MFNLTEGDKRGHWNSTATSCSWSILGIVEQESTQRWRSAICLCCCCLNLLLASPFKTWSVFKVKLTQPKHPANPQIQMQNNSGKLPAAISRHSKSSGSKWLKGFKRIRKDCQTRQISGPVPEGLRHAWLQLISNTVIFPGQALRDACLCSGGWLQLLPSTPALWFKWGCIWYKQRVCLAQFQPPAEP